MTKYLITPTLINSYQYYINDEFKSPADSRADFLKTLSRERFEPNEAMQKGIDFEDDIKFYCETGFFKGMGKVIDESELDFRDEYEMHIIYPKQIVKHNEPEYVIDYVIKDIGDIIKGGLWQQTCKKEIKVGNQEFLLYGKMDVIKRDTIYDIKYTRNYELGKFLDSAQHLIYLYCTGLPKFQYLISDGEDYWIEDYHNHINIENEIKSKISDFLSYLENDKEAKELFKTKWESK